MTSSTKRRGRPSKPHRCADGTEVHGLYRLPDGRWRITESGERFTEPDERLAVRKFRQWQAQHAPEFELPVVMNVTVQGNKDAKDIAEFLNSLPADAPDVFENDAEIDGATVKFKLPVEPSILWPWLRYVLLHEPEWLAKMTGVAEVAGLRHLPLDRDPLQLAELWQKYREGTGSIKDTVDATERTWKRFLAHTGATTTNDLTTEKLNAYRADIEATVPEASTRRYHYSKIKTVIGFGLKCGLDPQQIRQVLDRAKVLWEKATNAPANPQPISRADYHRLLKATKTKPWQPWRAWLLVGLNLCLHIGEACKLRWSEFDLKNGTYATIRGKTKRHHLPRAATLWPETIKALKELRASRRQSEFVFVSHIGKDYNRNKRVNSFGEFRTAAGLPEVTFDMIRDGAFTAACRRCPDERWARLLAGHKSAGMQDRYVLRNPAIVKPACDAVYEEYFGRTKGQRREH